MYGFSSLLSGRNNTVSLYSSSPHSSSYRDIGTVKMSGSSQQNIIPKSTNLVILLTQSTQKMILTVVL